MTPQEIIDRQDEVLEENSAKLKRKAASIIHKAELALIAWLLLQLTVQHDKIVQSAANLALIDRIPAKFQDLLQHYGFDATLKVYMREFDSQAGVFQELARSLGGRPVSFTDADTSYFSQRKKSATLTLLALVGQVAESLRANARLALGAPIDTLHEGLADVLPSLPAKLGTTYATELAVFSRTVDDRGFAIVQAGDPTTPLNYQYSGPGSGDPVIRPFCQDLMKQTEHGTTWTMDEIERMDNGQGLPVKTACGGHGCRHKWIAALHGR